MTTFALVHGAWHGAWCWERLAPELERLGHRVLAMDLPCDDAAATFTTYADVVVRGLEDESDDVVVVGHSLGGVTIPLVAARRPVRRLVFLCALLPAPGRTFDEQFGSERMLVAGHEAGLGPRDEEGRTSWVDFGVARDHMYSDCSEADARAAFERLRPQARAPYGEPCPLDALPDVEGSYVICAGDRMVSPDWSRRAAQERLAVEPVDLPGGHSPMLTRPADLALLLHEAG